MDDSTRFSLRRSLVGIAVIALVITAARFSVRAYHSLFEPHADFSAIWLTHDMLLSYLTQTDGEWPENWDDLQPIFDSPVSQPYGLPDLHSARERVSIDFDFEPELLTTSPAHSDRPVQFILMEDGSQNRETRAANQRIRSAILKHHAP